MARQFPRGAGGATAALARRTALMPGHSALSMPTCAIRHTMKKGGRSVRGSISKKPQTFQASESRKSRRLAVLASC